MQFQPHSRGLKRARNITISVVVLLILLVGGGLAYTYFFGPTADENAAATAPVAPAEPVLKPHAADPKAPVGASVTIVTSPVAPGDNASITIKTTPGADCKIAVVYGSVASTDSGLAPKKADEFGTLSWTWTVERTAALGNWPLKVDCAYLGKSAMVQTNLLVAKPTP